ncbi:MAG: zinc-binding dehydrogenase [Flavobacteriales bacterium]|jgi:NADPH2:quinone reductase|nr:zinc-binding dehydrogenase [Flavobacteriales bacterium]
MRAWTLTAHGDPHKVLELQDRPDPVPGAGQVLVRAEGFGLNYADTMAVRGLYRDAPPPPTVLGYEVVGRVERCGADAPPDLMGRRVVAFTRFGGHAELAVTDHRACAVIHDAVPLGEALALATQGCTAWYAAQVACPLWPGLRVLVHSAAGGVGQLLVQMARNAGCTVIAVASGPDKMRRLWELGAHHVVDRAAGDAYAAVRRALDGAPLDVSFNAVGGSTFKRDMALLGSGGRLLVYGGAERGAGGMLGTLRFVWRMGLVVPILLMMRSHGIIGVNMLRISEAHPELLARCLRAVVAAHHAGELRAHVHAEHPTCALPQAIAELAAGRTMGKVALRWPDTFAPCHEPPTH